MNMQPTDKYLLLFRSADWYEGLPQEQVEKIVADWAVWFQRLTAEGIAQAGSPLAPGGKIVGGKDAKAITDGPFLESKETVGGYFMVRADSLDAAVKIAQGCPGLPFGIRVEVRQVLVTCPFGEQTASMEAPALATA